MDDIERYLRPQTKAASLEVGWNRMRPMMSGGGYNIGNQTAGVRPLAVSALVETQGQVRDGSLVVALVPAWETIIQLLKEDPGVLYNLPSEKWEELVAASYERAGFDTVILTPRSGDLGRDVIAEKHGYWSVRIIDQVKAYRPGHLVPANDVRALAGVLLADHSATKGVVTTTSDFAPRLRDDPILKPLIPYKLELINHVELFRRIRETR